MKDPGSFRDPSGFIFIENDEIYRAINPSYGDHFDFFESSGLYKNLLKYNFIVEHEKIRNENYHRTLKVEKIFPFTYPYEWSFDQFKDAAIFTLEIQKKSIEFGMTLKDATPYNVQFKNNKPIFIDTLSFEKINDEDYSWIAYKQFCETFLYPLILMSKVDSRLNKLMINFIDGIPIDLALKLIDFKAKLNPFIFLNLVLPSILSKKSKTRNSKIKITKKQHLNLIDQFLHSMEGLQINKTLTEWDNYNNETLEEKDNYVHDKINNVNSFTKGKKYNIVWDIGSNDGYYSRFFKTKANSVISLDIDMNCVNRNYIINKKESHDNITPILFDISNPSPGIGWKNEERSSIYSRIGNPDIILFFAIMHHIINNNIPIENIVDFLFAKAKNVLFEYIPFNDPKCLKIFKSRPENFVYPSLDDFINLLNGKFEIEKSVKLKGTDRVLFLLKNSKDEYK